MSRPDGWVKSLFGKFAAIYGAQKTAGMWAGVDQDEMQRIWAAQVGRYSNESIGRACQKLVESGSEWPPTLPEFCKLCVEAGREREQAKPPPALPAPVSMIPPEIIAERKALLQSMLGKIGGSPSKLWAQRIIARAESGEDVLPVALDMARRALRIEAEHA